MTVLTSNTPQYSYRAGAKKCGRLLYMPYTVC